MGKEQKFNKEYKQAIYMYWKKTGCTLRQLSEKFNPDSKQPTLVSRIISEQIKIDAQTKSDLKFTALLMGIVLAKLMVIYDVL